MSSAMQAPPTMSGVLLEEPGDISTLRWVTSLSIPIPKDNEVLVRNEYAGVNFMDTHFRSGRYPASYPLILGGEGVGTVVSVHSSVTERLKPGDRVAYLARAGAYAQYVAVSTKCLVKLPELIPSEVAAATLAQGLTALTLVREAYTVKASEWVLIHGASGGVGSLLVQMCKAIGARVIATVSAAPKMDRVMELGAEHVIDTSVRDWVAEVTAITGSLGANVIFDPLGRATFDGDIEAIARKGTLVCFGNASGKIPPVDVLRLGGTKNLKLCYPTVFAYLSTADETQGYANELFEMVQKGGLNIDGYKVYDLIDVGKAHEELEDRKASGKVVLRIP